MVGRSFTETVREFGAQVPDDQREAWEQIEMGIALMSAALAAVNGATGSCRRLFEDLADRVSTN